VFYYYLKNILGEVYHFSSVLKFFFRCAVSPLVVTIYGLLVELEHVEISFLLIFIALL
jgi:hypothetical protein